jgi:hypothetical protein
MKEIELNYGYKTIVDDEDFEELIKYHWFVSIENKHMYALSTSFPKLKNPVPMHRFILKLTDLNVFVDHINRDGLDNRKENLRIANKQQNAINCGPYKNNKTGYKGVRIRKDKYKDTIYFRIIASIKFNGKHIHIGYFKNLEDAAKEYDKKAIELFGEFAYLNFPEEYI